MTLNLQVHTAESPIVTLRSQRNRNRLLFNMNPLINDIDLVDMDDIEKENRSVGSELARKHVIRGCRKTIPLNSSSESEDQDSMTAMVPAMPPKTIKNKERKKGATIIKVVKSASLEKAKSDLQFKSTALRKCQKELKVEQAEVLKVKKLHQKALEDVKKLRSEIKDKDKTIKTLERRKEAPNVSDAEDEIERLKRKIKVLIEEYDNRLKLRKKDYNTLLSAKNKLDTDFSIKLERANRLLEKSEEKIKKLADEQTAKKEQKADEATVSKLVLIDAERSASLEKMQHLARNHQDAAYLKDRNATQKRSQLLSLGSGVSCDVSV